MHTVSAERGRMRNAFSSIARVLVASGCLALVAHVAPALASSAPIHVTDNVNLRSGPSTSSARVGGIYRGASPDFHCWTQGQTINGLDVWFNVTYNGGTGFYASYYDDSHYTTDSQITSKYRIPMCGSQPTSPQGTTASPQRPGVDRMAQNVGRWGAAHNGAIWASAIEHRELALVGADWRARGDGPYGEWAGDCYRFAFLAWYANGVRPMLAATAQAAATAYQRAGKMHAGVPPAGAMVFYAYGSLGHVGISIGNGHVISTHGLDYSYRSISPRPYNQMGLSYIGWVDPRS